MQLCCFEAIDVRALNPNTQNGLQKTGGENAPRHPPQYAQLVSYMVVDMMEWVVWQIILSVGVRVKFTTTVLYQIFSVQ